MTRVSLGAFVVMLCISTSAGAYNYQNGTSVHGTQQQDAQDVQDAASQESGCPDANVQEVASNPAAPAVPAAPVAEEVVLSDGERVAVR